MARDERLLEWNPFEQEVQRRARRFTYPPAPDLAVRLAGALPAFSEPHTAVRRRLAWALVVILVAVAGLALVEPVRAWVVEVLRLGAVRIISPAPPPARTPLPVHLGWGGQTELVQAAAELPFAVHLPTLPADLGLPDAAYVQDLNGPALLLVWMDPAQPRRVRLTLHALSSEAMAYKMDPPLVEETVVNGQPALWTNGPYIVALRSGDWVSERLVAGHVLIWTENGVTYRLESDLPLAEAVAIAESLHPWSPP
jgi:hypothetical protein